MQTIYILHAQTTNPNHKFIELFQSIQSLNTFLNNNPQVTKTEITLHEVNS